MNRRELLKRSGILAAGSVLGTRAAAAAVTAGTYANESAATGGPDQTAANGSTITGGPDRPPGANDTTIAGHKHELQIAHITDIHIPADGDAPGRLIKCLEEVKKHNPDFILNGGDSIMDASYDTVTRDQVTAQWKTWDHCIQTLQSYEIHSCIGNHDSWWAAPSHDDEMYGKAYATKRLKIPNRYYSFSKKSWHFIILDGNNKDVSLDDEQYAWLEKELDGLPSGTPTLLMSHYPILGTTALLVGGGHADRKKLKDLFYRHRDKVKICLSGHQHLHDKTWYDGVWYCCNGAMSGFWWGKGDKESAGPYYYQETPPGYAILRLYADGRVENEYIPHNY